MEKMVRLGKKIDLPYKLHLFSFLNKSLFYVLLVFFASCIPKQNIVGNHAPEFENIVWLNGPEQKISNLLGKVVLLRWWTDGCEYCTHSAPSLNDWNINFRDSGLLVIGMYHPKPAPQNVDLNEIYKFIRDKKFVFPIGIDSDWNNLNNYWLSDGPKSFTSVSFLIDKKGKIRHLHPGGEFHKDTILGHEKCISDYWQMDSIIRVLIAE
jgi:peroxiredoxin